MAPLCRNWTQDANGAQRRMINSVKVMRRIADDINHLAARQVRVLFSQDQDPTALDTAGAAPFMVWRYFDDGANADTRIVRVLLMPRTSGSGNCSASLGSSGATPNFNATATSNSWPEDVEYAEFVSSRNAPANDEFNESLITANGFQVLDIVEQDMPMSSLDSTTDLCVDDNVAVAGNPILADIVEDCRAALYDLHMTNQQIVLNWSATRRAAGWVTSASGLVVPGDARGMMVDSTSYVNLMNQAITTRTANSPGVSCAAEYCGIGEDTTVDVQLSVFAAAETVTGFVKFIGPDNIASNDVTISVAAGAAAAWYDAGTYLKLNTTAGKDSATDTTRNKVDVHGKANATGTLYVYAIRGWVRYTTMAGTYVEQIGPEFYPDLTATTVTRSLSGTTARSAQLPTGRYVCVSSINFYVKVGNSTVNATTSDFLVPAMTPFSINVTTTNSNDYVAGITDGGTGTLYMIRGGAAA